MFSAVQRRLVTRLQAPCRPFFHTNGGNGNHRPVFFARLSAYKTSCSVPTSRFAVISSSSRIDGFAATARAMDKSCHRPCETVHPCRAYHTLPIPAITSCSPASFAASTILSGNRRIVRNLLRTVPGTRLSCSHAAKQTPSDTVPEADKRPVHIFLRSPLRTIQPQKQFKNCVCSFPAPVRPVIVTCSPVLSRSSNAPEPSFLFMAEADVFRKMHTTGESVPLRWLCQALSSLFSPASRRFPAASAAPEILRHASHLPAPPGSSGFPCQCFRLGKRFSKYRNYRNRRTDTDMPKKHS